MGEVEVSLPEAVVGGLVAEDEHEADDDGKRGNGGGRETEVGWAKLIGVADGGCEGKVEEDGDGYVRVDGAYKICQPS